MAWFEPRTRSKRECESPMDEYRMAKGWTERELSERAGVKLSDIYPLKMGVLPPVYSSNYGNNYKGQLKPVAQRLCEALGVGPEDLFPRYVCKIRTEYEEFTDNQLLDLSQSDFSVRESRGQPDREMSARLFFAMVVLGRRERLIVTRRYVDGKTFEESGFGMGITRERIRQIEIRALQKMKRYMDKAEMGGKRGA